MQRASKLRRLDAFRRAVPHVSASALSAILAEALNGILDIRHRHAMRQARDFQVNQMTPYGPLRHALQLECTDGSQVDLEIINPFAQLYIAAKECQGFAYMVKRRFDQNTPTADHRGYVLYSDEVLPGNQLSAHNMRKGMGTILVNFPIRRSDPQQRGRLVLRGI